jgi:hypothetical protein
MLVGVAVGLTACALAGCGSANPDPPTARSDSQVPVLPVIARGRFLFLTHGSAALAALVAGAPGLPARGCPEATIRGVNGGSAMEIDLFGRHPPGCALAVAELRRVPSVLRAGIAGRVGDWRCVWTHFGSIGCRRGTAVLAASSPGE